VNRVKYKGYVVIQDKASHHVMVSQNGQMVMHVPCVAPKSEADLCDMVDFYETIVEKMDLGGNEEGK